MILFFSGAGGARSNIPETILKDPGVMLSYHTNVTDGTKPDRRFKAILKLKRKKGKKR